MTGVKERRCKFICIYKVFYFYVTAKVREETSSREGHTYNCKSNQSFEGVGTNSGGTVGNAIAISWITENCVGHIDLIHVQEMAHGRCSIH